jgi:hypothetical protein
MRPMLDDLELELVQEIDTYELRTLAEHKPPGMSGSLLQNLGRRPTRLVLWGVVSGPEALSITGKLDEKFRAAKPVPFTADIIKDAEIELMFIEDLKIQELAGKPERFAYVLTLREFIEPVEPAEAPPELEAGILDDATGLLDDLVDGLDLAPLFSTGLEQFVEPLTGLLGRLQEFNRSNNTNNP